MFTGMSFSWKCLLFSQALAVGILLWPKLERAFLACALDKRAWTSGRVRNPNPSVEFNESERLFGYAGHSC